MGEREKEREKRSYKNRDAYAAAASFCNEKRGVLNPADMLQQRQQLREEEEQSERKVLRAEY